MFEVNNIIYNGILENKSYMKLKQWNNQPDDLGVYIVQLLRFVTREFIKVFLWREATNFLKYTNIVI